jgi:hypothetical protein
MKKYILLFCAFCAITAIFLASGCSRPIEGTGPVVNQKMNLLAFTSLELEIDANVTIAISDSQQTVLRAQQNIAQLIEFKSDGDELIIKSKEDFNTSSPVEIVLTAKQLKRIIVNGSGDVKVINPVRGKELRVEINGSGDVELNANVDKLRTEMNGSGDIVYKGKSIKQRIRMNGSGNLNASALQTEECDIRIAGSGDASLNVNVSLDAEVLGSGNIHYTGTPKVQSEITGSGDISKN